MKIEIKAAFLFASQDGMVGRGEIRLEDVTRIDPSSATKNIDRGKYSVRI